MKRKTALPKSGGLFPEWLDQQLGSSDPLADKPERLRVMHKAHPPTPGREGKTCKSCRFLERHQRGGTWLKCGKFSKNTSGSGTDWRAGWPACGLYTPGPFVVVKRWD